MAEKIAKVDARLNELEAENRHLDERLSFLLKGDAEIAESFRNEYQKRFLALKSEEQELAGKKSQLQALQRQIAAAQEPSKNGGIELINEALNDIKNHDMIALKSIYRRLFKKIIVRPLDAAKVRLQFFFKDLSTIHAYRRLFARVKKSALGHSFLHDNCGRRI
ncbi:MAG: hypothetical protein OYH77_07900 [Pseudomonadota bacterium]|nr:hypothetical protein [Pseudomonadota bacterium]